MLMKKTLNELKNNNPNAKILLLEVENLDKNFFLYLKNDLKVLRFGNWGEFKKSCLYFQNQLEN
jgi:hypothetical protein